MMIQGRLSFEKCNDQHIDKNSGLIHLFLQGRVIVAVVTLHLIVKQVIIVLI